MIKDNLLKIQENISNLEAELNIKQATKIIAVSKKQPIEKINTLLDLGIHNFGENYVKEFLDKYKNISNKERFNENKKIFWHFIGSLQSKKVKDVIGKTTLIHTVDREKIAIEINKRAEEKNIIQDILVQVNIAREDSKSGVFPEEGEKLIELILKNENLNLVGLMTMPPLYDEAQKSQSDFSKLRELLIKWNDSIVQSDNFFELSMGTSHDYEYAVKEGATMIRLGTILLGERVF